MLFSVGKACSLPPVSVLAKTDFLKRTTALFFLWCLIAILCYIRLGNARGEKSKNVLKGKLLKLRGSGRRKKKLAKEAALAKIRQEKALSLGAEPEKGPNVTQVNTSSLN